MSRFEIRVTCTEGDELHPEDTERMAITKFCEVLSDDATKLNSDFPVGTEVVLNDLENRRELLRYVVGYE